MGSTVEETKPASSRLPTTDWMLRCESGPLSGKLFPLSERMVIGRALTCDISIPEGGLSREHAEMLVVSNQLFVRDLESSNGTFHNGERVAEARPAHGDLVAFDNMRFRVIGPSNDMDRTIISMAPARIAKATAPSVPSTADTPPAVPGDAVPAAARAAAAGAPAARAPAAPVTARAAAPPPAGGIPAWVVLVGLAVAVVGVIVYVTTT